MPYRLSRPNLTSQKEHDRIPFDLLPPSRTMTQQVLELSRKRTKPAEPRAKPIEHVADRIRRHFFRDQAFHGVKRGYQQR